MYGILSYIVCYVCILLPQFHCFASDSLGDDLLLGGAKCYPQPSM